MSKGSVFVAQKSTPKSPEGIDTPADSGLPTPERARRLPLKTAQHVRSELARVYRNMKHGDIEPATGTKLTYVLVALGKMIEVGDLEKRIEALELENAARKS